MNNVTSLKRWLWTTICLIALAAAACAEDDGGTSNGTTSGSTNGNDTSGSSGVDTSGSTSGDDTSGSTSGDDTSGSTSGDDTSGSTSGNDTSGSTSGDDTSGSTENDTSGSTENDTSGGDTSGTDDTSGGDTSGTDDTVDGDTSGSTSGDTSGSTSGGTICVPSCASGSACVEGVCTPVNDIPSPSEGGEVIFTEVMANPKRADLNGEWMEFYNTSDFTYNLRGCIVVQSTGGQYTISATTNGMILQPGQHATTGGAGDSALGFDATFNYSSSTFVLTDSNNTLTLRCDGIDIDSVSYTVTTSGYSLNLDPSAYDATANDNAASWCDSPAGTYSTNPAEEHGTPNVINPSCQ